MKKYLKTGAIVLGVVLVLSFTKDLIAKASVEGACRVMTGLRLSIGQLHLSLIQSSLGIKDLKLFNPPSFKDKLMVDLPEVYVCLYPGSLMGSEVHLKELRLNLKEVTIIKNADGKLNLDALKRPGAEKKEEAKEKGAAKKIRVDSLHIKIQKVIYKDYSSGRENVQEFNVNIEQSYEGVSDVRVIVPIIVSQALMNTTLSSIVNFDMKGFMSNFDSQGLNMKELGLDRFASSAGGAADKAVKGLSGLFDTLTDRK